MSLTIAAGSARLAQRYPQVPADSVRAIVEDAYGTVTRMLGRPDLETALDLAQLRLDVRTRRVA